MGFYNKRGNSYRVAFAVLVSLISALVGEFSRNRMPSQHRIFLAIPFKNWRGLLIPPRVSSSRSTALRKKAVSMRGLSSALSGGTPLALYKEFA